MILETQIIVLVESIFFFIPLNDLLFNFCKQKWTEELPSLVCYIKIHVTFALSIEEFE